MSPSFHKWPGWPGTGIRNRIVAGFLVMAALSLLASGASLALLLSGRGALDAATSKALLYAADAHRAGKIVSDVNTHILRSLIQGEGRLPEALRALDAQSTEFYRLLDRMSETLPEQATQHKELKLAYAAFYMFSVRMLALGEIDAVAKRTDIFDQFHERQDLLFSELGQTLASLAEVAEGRIGEAKAYATFMWELTLVMAAFTLLFAVSIALMLSRSFVRPMTELLRMVEATEGAADIPPEPRWGGDEVGRLGRAFHQMRRRLARREQELILRRHLETMGRLAGGVAHEFNNLLGAIAACLHPLRNPGVTAAQLREEVDRLSLLCRRGGELSAQLLAVAGRKDSQLDDLDPAYFLEQIRPLVERLVPREITLSLWADADLPSVRCSAALLHSSLLNLVLNSVDALPGGGVIEVSCTAERAAGGKRFVVFRVRDDGEGVPAEVIPHVFDPFFTTKEEGKGTGLGLSIVHSFARQSGGTVEVESNDAGTSFRLHLPARAEARSRRAVLLTADTEGGQALAAALEKRGFTVLNSRPGRTSLDTVRELTSPVDLMVLDVAIEEVSPDALYRLMRRFFPTASFLFVGGDDELAGRVDPDVAWAGSLPAEEVARMAADFFSPKGFPRFREEGRAGLPRRLYGDTMEKIRRGKGKEPIP